MSKTVLKAATVLFIALNSIFCIQAQNSFQSSFDGRLFVRSNFKGATTERMKVNFKYVVLPKVDLWYTSDIKVYNTKDNSLLHSLTFIAPDKGKPDEIGFSNNNMFVYAKKGNYFSIWEVQSGNEIISLQASAIGFSDFTNRIYAAQIDRFNKSVINVYETPSLPTPVRVYAYSGRINAKKIVVSNTERYFFVSTTSNRIILWKSSKANPIEKFTASNAEFCNDGKNLTLSYDRIARIYSYDLVAGRLQSYPLATYTNDLVYKMTFDKNAPTRRIIKDKISIVPGGTMAAIPAKYKSGNTYKYEIFLVDLKANKMVSYMPNHTIESKTPWINGEELVVMNSDSVSKMYNVYKKEASEMVDFNFYIDNQSDEKLESQTFVSPNNKVAVLSNEPKKGNPSIVVKSTSDKYQKKVVENVRFVGFTNNSKNIIVEDMDGNTGLLAVSDLMQMTSATDSLKCNFAGNKPSQPLPEDEIFEDAIQPDNFNYIPLNKMRHISELSPDQRVNLILKTVKSDELNTTLEIHLLDSSGVYYYGASEPEYKHIWNSLILKSSNGLKQVEDFKVSERKRNDSIPQAVALVLDHSGSMGENRAIALQEVAQKFINDKAPKDAVTILKYDEKVLVESDLSTNKVKLLDELKMNGLEGFNGSTALLEATNLGLNQLVNKNGFDSKSVILFTDGKENASHISEATVIMNAIQSRTNIFTIAFGEDVDEKYLKSIAGYSGGSYFHIYKTEDFDWIFQDVFNRIQNYYAIDFQTDSIDDYAIMLSVKINPASNDSMFVEFTNAPIDFSEMIQEDELQEPISNATPDANVINDISKFQETKRVEAIRIRDEFANINFPNILFEIDTTLIVSGSELGIDEVAAFMNKYPKVALKIYGHTDNKGNDAHNLLLSEKRANAVKNILTGKGVLANRIGTQGFGETKPLTTNETEDGRAINRRVEFVLDLSTFSLPDFVAMANAANKANEDEITVFPNPTVGEFYINFPTSDNFNYQDIKSIQIIDVNGKIVSERKQIQSARQQFNLAGKARGMYFVNIILPNSVISHKIELK